MKRNMTKALGKPEAIKGNARDKPSSDRPSLWKSKYGSSRSVNNDPTLTQILDTFLPKQPKINNVSSLANEPPGSYFESITIDCTSIEEDAVNVISQMNSLLGGKFETTPFRRSIKIFDQEVAGQNINGLDDDTEYNVTTFFQAPELHNQQLQKPDYAPALSLNGTANQEDDFSGEAIAILFRRSNDETHLKKCFCCIRALTKANKQIRCQVFSSWKSIANDAKETYDVIIRRFHRRHRLRHLRSLCSSWFEVMETCASDDLGQRATKHYNLQTKRNVLLSWCKQSRRLILRKAEYSNIVANIRKKKMNQAFVGWLVIKRENCINSNKDESCPKEDMADRSSFIVEEYQTGIGEIVTSDKNLSSEQLNPKCQEDDIDDLLIPVRSQRQKATTSRPITNPNHLLKMNQRKMDRDKRREMLRQRYGQKAIEQKQQQEEERRKKEDAETRVQREYFASKVTAEQEKKQATARWKRAWYLAVLHYQRSLQQRIFKQFRQILQIQSFNHRKVSKYCRQISIY